MSEGAFEVHAKSLKPMPVKPERAGKCWQDSLDVTRKLDERHRLRQGWKVANRAFVLDVLRMVKSAERYATRGERLKRDATLIAPHTITLTSGEIVEFGPKRARRRSETEDERFSRIYGAWMAVGIDLLQGHPWEKVGAVLALWQEAERARDFRRMSIYRKTAKESFTGRRREGTEWPSFMVPKYRGTGKGGRSLHRKKRGVVADDPCHKYGECHGLRQWFEALTRRDEQVHAVAMMRAAEGSAPVWMKPREKDKAGRPPKKSKTSN